MRLRCPDGTRSTRFCNILSVRHRRSLTHFWLKCQALFPSFFLGSFCMLFCVPCVSFWVGQMKTWITQAKEYMLDIIEQAHHDESNLQLRVAFVGWVFFPCLLFLFMAVDRTSSEHELAILVQRHWRDGSPKAKSNLVCRPILQRLPKNPAIILVFIAKRPLVYLSRQRFSSPWVFPSNSAFAVEYCACITLEKTHGLFALFSRLIPEREERVRPLLVNSFPPLFFSLLPILSSCCLGRCVVLLGYDG